MEVPNRDEHEDELLLLLLLVFDELTADMIHGRIIPWQAYRDRISQILRQKLASIFLLAAMVWSAPRPAFDLNTSAPRPAFDLNTSAAATAAVGWATSVAANISDRFVAGVQAAFAGVLALGTGSTEFIQKVSELASRGRAEGLVITEITAAQTAGGAYAAGLYAATTGTTLTAVWVTERDKRVCPICSPLNGTKQEVWSLSFPNGPPAHPRCRCRISHQ